MNVLLIGSGGREHALAWKLKQSPKVNALFIAPGNAGTAEIGKNISLSPTDFAGIEKLIEKKQISFVVVGPEAPLVEGIVDYFKAIPKHQNLKVLGPSKAASLLEGSKSFAKNFMQKYHIPTAKYAAFSAENLSSAMAFLDQNEPPYVLKADGLAGGKGVLIVDEIDQAKSVLKSMLLDQKFGAASKKVVIEEFLDGIEMSVFVLTDGKNYKIFPEAKDYKRIGEGDTGLNTGGMGAVSPVPFADKKLMKKIEDRIIQASISGIKSENLHYCGFLFIGLMIVKGEPYVIEYNVRLGDPETEVILPRLDSDLFSHLDACLTGTLNREKLQFSAQTAATVILVSGGYPEKYEKNKKIEGFENLGDCILFHAGTKLEQGSTYTNGGRVFAVTGKGDNLKDALAKSYRNADRILFEKKAFRKDIGFDLLG